MITNEMIMTLDKLKARYHYLSRDVRNTISGGEHRIPMPIDDILHGDAADYTLSLLASLSGSSASKLCKAMVNGRAVLHVVDINTRRGVESHCVLEFNNECCDNNLKRWVSKYELIKSGNYVFRRKITVQELVVRGLMVWLGRQLTRVSKRGKRR